MSGTPEKPGLQFQRTQLSWERTAVGYLAVGGALLMHPSNWFTWDRTLLGALAALMSLTVLAIARRRGGEPLRVDGSGRSVVGDPYRAIQLVGWGTTGLAVAIALMIFLG